MSDESVKALNQNDMDRIIDKADILAKAKSLNGKSVVEFKPDGVYLTVTPPEPGGSPLNSEEVIRDLEARGISGIDPNKVNQTVREMRGQSQYIAPPQRELAEEGRVVVEISQNKMEAYITVYPPRGGGKTVTREDAQKALQEKNVVSGIIEDTIDLAINLQHGESLTVARGTEPVEGENASIELKFAQSSMAGKPAEMVDGRVDFYNLHLVHSVEPGDILAVKIPATNGKPGFTVTGEELPTKPGKDIQLSPGKNAEISEDGLALRSTARGHVVVSGNKVGVSNIFEVAGDVDFNTGNIEFNGTVIIKGRVKEGFKVVADGDVEVMDTVTDGMVECQGSLKVKNGIVGRSKCRIKAGGSVLARFIENSVVEAGADVIIGEAIMHSQINARKTVVVGGKGVIVGGLVRAGEEINCKIVGSTMATVTELETGVSPDLRRKYADLLKVRQAKEIDRDKAEKAVKLLNYLEQTQGKLPEDKQAILLRVSRVLSELTREMEEIKETVNDLEYHIKLSERGRIKVHGVIHPGVKITIGSASMQTRDDYSFVCLTRVGADIKVNPYK